jgi:hypothetical protein
MKVKKHNIYDYHTYTSKPRSISSVTQSHFPIVDARSTADGKFTRLTNPRPNLCFTHPRIPPPPKDAETCASESIRDKRTRYLSNLIVLHTSDRINTAGRD